MAELIPLFLAGLAFFFIGVSGISSNLRQMSGRKIRQLLSRATNRPVFAGMCGFLFGMLTQSSSAVAFILSGMISSGLLTLRRSLPVLATANVGTSVLVFLAALDMHLAIFWLLAVSGLSLAFKWAGKWTPAAGALFAVGMLFYGLDMMKEAFAPLPQMQGFKAFASFMQGWPYAPFLLGMFLRMIIQSSSAIGVIAITLAGGGLLDEFQAMLLICGAGVGVGISAYMLSGNLKGVPRQIVIYQALINTASGISLASMLAADRLAGGVLRAKAFDVLSVPMDGRIAFMFLVLMLGCLFFGLVTQKWMPDWLERLCPTTPEQDFSRPIYIHDEALEAPESAVDLAGREQMRIIKLLPGFLEAARSRKAMASIQPLHEAAGTLGGEIGHFLQELITRPSSSELSSQVLARQQLVDLLKQLEENVYRFVETVRSVEWSGARAEVADRLVESLDTIVLTSIDAFESGDDMDLELLLKMTEDRGELMERLRKATQKEEGSLEEQSALHYATSLFERDVWLLRQAGLWIKAGKATG